MPGPGWPRRPGKSCPALDLLERCKHHFSAASSSLQVGHKCDHVDLIALLVVVVFISAVAVLLSAVAAVFCLLLFNKMSSSSS